jgi:hypothetical protein
MSEQDRVAMLSDLRALERKFERLEERLEQRIDERLAAEAETTRRHFDIAAESIRDIIKPVAELASHHSTVLDDHEHRLHKIEQRGR